MKNYEGAYVAAIILVLGVSLGMLAMWHIGQPSVDSVRSDLCRVPYQELVSKSQNDPNLAGVVIALCVPSPRAQTASVPSDAPMPAKTTQEQPK